VVVGLALRLTWADDFLFRFDEVKNLEYSLRVSRDGEWVRHAWESSIGVPNGPAFVYWLAAFSRFSLDPLVANLSVTLANVVAMLVAIPFFRRVLRGPGEAECAMALWATSPVAIWYSRKIWDPCLLPLLATPVLVLAIRALQVERAKSVFWIPPLLAVAVQAHQSALFLGAVVGLTLASAGRRIAWGWLAGGVAVAAALLVPFGSYLAEEWGKSVSLPASGGSKWPDVDVVTNLLLDASGHNILDAAGREAPWLLLWPFPPVGLLVQLALAPLFVHFVTGYVETWKPRRGELPPGARRLLLGVGLGLPALYLVLRVRGVAHYFLSIFPVLYALIVIGSRRVAGWGGARRPFFRLPVLVGLSAASWLLFQSYISAHHGSTHYGLPYRRIVEACADVAAAAAERGLGTPERPLRLAVDIPRERRVLPNQYRYVLERLLATSVREPAEGEGADLTLRIRWPHPGRLEAPPWEIVESGGLCYSRARPEGPSSWPGTTGRSSSRATRGRGATTTSSRPSRPAWCSWARR